MLIPIQAEDGDSVRWSILELQGTVTARDEGPVAGLPLGRLEVKQVRAAPLVPATPWRLAADALTLIRRRESRYCILGATGR